MKKYIDTKPKQNHAILDNYLLIPDVSTPEQAKAFKQIVKLYKHTLVEEKNAKIA